MGAAAKVGFPDRGTWLNRMVERGIGPPAEVCALTGAATGCLKTACAYGSNAPSPACISAYQSMLKKQCYILLSEIQMQFWWSDMLLRMGKYFDCLEKQS